MIAVCRSASERGRYSMASDREQFCLAVRTIYESDAKEERNRAEQWLETWQRQSSAWETAASVLDDANSTDDERFMASQTLRTKARPYLLFQSLLRHCPEQPADGYHGAAAARCPDASRACALALHSLTSWWQR